MKTLLMSAAISLAATAANADGYSPEPLTNHIVRIVEVIPQYVQQPQQIVQRVCYQEQVPVRRHSDGGDVLAGALIGGAIGNQFGQGDGKDAMTILGAIVGANAGSNNRPVVGYEVRDRCQDQVSTQYVDVFSHYTVIFIDQGQRYRVDTLREFFVGERVPYGAF